jgi:hypothetical protein
LVIPRTGDASPLYPAYVQAERGDLALFSTAREVLRRMDGAGR